MVGGAWVGGRREEPFINHSHYSLKYSGVGINKSFVEINIFLLRKRFSIIFKRSN